MPTVAGFRVEKADVVKKWYDVARKRDLMKIYRHVEEDAWVFIVSTPYSWNPALLCLIIAIPIFIFASIEMLLIPVGIYLVLRWIFSGSAVYAIANLALRHKHDYRGRITYLNADECTAILMEDVERGNLYHP